MDLVNVGTVLGELGSGGQFHTVAGNQFTSQILSPVVQNIVSEFCAYTMGV